MRASVKVRIIFSALLQAWVRNIDALYALHRLDEAAQVQYNTFQPV